MFRVLLVCVIAALAHGRLAPHFLEVGSGIGIPSAVQNKYHTTETILKQMAELDGNCAVLSKHEIQVYDPSSNGPRSNSAYTLTDPNSPKEGKKRFMLTFGMHGREYISSETALHLAKTVCSKMSTTNTNQAPTVAAPPAAALTSPDVSSKSSNILQNVLSPQPVITPSSLLELSSEEQPSGMSAERVATILKNTEIVFVPVLNIDGRKKVETGESCTAQRKNGRSVDINRNFANWFNPQNAMPTEEDYQGTTSMSEWESNVVRTLAEQLKPHAYIDIHSGDLGMGYVFGHSGSERSPHDETNRKWAQAINQEVFGGKVWVGNLANMGSMPYESHGSSCDYMYQTQHAHIAGTWEIWRKPSFFSAAASSTSVALALKPGNGNAGKYDHVTVTSVKIDSLPEQAAIQTSAKTAVDQELVSLVQTSMGKDVSEGLGLTEGDIMSLVQTMKGEGKHNDEIQVLLQEMSREQCFTYFNPVLPDHYDHTVNSFARAILIGAEKLSNSDIAASLAA